MTTSPATPRSAASRRRRRLTLLLFSALLLGAPALARLGGVTLPAALTEALLYLPPLLVSTLLCVLLGRTLLPGRRPLITAMATLVHNEITPAIAVYTRRVTSCWALFFAALALQLALLWLSGAGRERLAAVGAGNALAAVLLFGGEFLLRRRCLPDARHLTFGEFLRFLGRVDLALLRTLR